MEMETPARPEGIRYSQEHEWVAVDSDGIGAVGISDYAAGELGDVVYVDLPAAGTVLVQFEKMGEIESVKAVSDLYAPVSGEVVAVNDRVTTSPELVNEQPFGDGWLLRVRLSNSAELENLMDNDAYDTFLKDVDHH